MAVEMRKCITNSNKYYRNILCFMRLYVCTLFGMVALVMQTLPIDFRLRSSSKLRIIEHLYPISEDLSLDELLRRNERWTKNENKTPIEIQSGSIIFKISTVKRDRNDQRKKNWHTDRLVYANE